MNTENFCLSSKTIELSEHDNYLELVNRLCYYDDSNLNDVMLPYKNYEEKALECAKTLINMPVQARYKKINNLDDLGGHEMRISPDGRVEWGTQSVGVHVSIEIKDDTVTTVSGVTKVLPCLFATSRIWKRYKNITSAIKRLYNSEGGLNTSWEIATSAYEYKGGVKILTDYEFLANTFLGSNVVPAYSGTSKTLSLSSFTEQELMVAEALSQDIVSQCLDKNNEEKEDDTLKEDKDITLVSEEQEENPVTSEESSVDDTSEKKDSDDNDDELDDDMDDDDEDGECKKKKGCSSGECKKKKNCSSTETSALTTGDLHRKISEECRKKIDGYCWVSFMFPEEHEVWCEYDGDSALDYLRFTYSVENDEVTVSDPEEVKLTVSVKAINSTISEYEKTISEKDDLIVKASSEITSLKAENAELSQYKEKFTQMEQEKAAAELAQKKEELIASVIRSGQLTREEIENSEEFSGYVNNLDKKSLMAIVGERLSASVNTASKDVETSESKNDTHVASNLNNEDDEVLDGASIMRNYLKNK